MVSISLCMIVRNEEKVLGRCLACVQGFADEIIIVDTGSTDRTKEIAFSFTDKVYDFKWKDDFAAARNFAFSRGTGDYLFWLDADDVIRQEEWRKLMDLKRRLDMERPDVVMMKYAVGYDGDGAPSFFFYRERLLRRCGKAVWKGRIHEAVEPFGKVVREDIMIEHRKVGIGDPDRNLRIFEQMLREKGKLLLRKGIILPQKVSGCCFCIFGISGTAGWLAGRPGGCLQAWGVLYVPDRGPGPGTKVSAFRTF